MERFFYALHRQKIKPLNDDKLLLKGSRDEGFSMKLMYKVIDQSSDIVFPFRSISNSTVPPKMGFFRLGKLLGVKCSLWIRLNVGEELLLTNVIFVRRTKRQYNIFFSSL